MNYEIYLTVPIFLRIADIELLILIQTNEITGKIVLFDHDSPITRL